MLGRRAFVGGAVAAMAGVSASGRASASDRVRVAMIGVRGRGFELFQTFRSDPTAEVVALCDVDSGVLGRRLKAAGAGPNSQLRGESDFRRLLDEKSIDAVVVATPDHWHAMATILACQAGKDVYVEKPVSHNVVEGRRMVEAGRKYGRVVQSGMQRRSAPWVAEVIRRVKSGSIGKVGMVRTWTNKVRPNIGHSRPSAVPPGVDYAMWQGPAPDRPFHANRFHYNWHWFWNWGTGELGNNGIHAIDLALWGMGVDSPSAVVSSGGTYILTDDRETPDTQITTWEFPGVCLTWEHRMWTDHPVEGSYFGLAFHGEKGTLLINEKGWRLEDQGDPQSHPGENPQALHVRNFLDCVKSRSKPNADIEIGHASTRLCHLGNIAHRVGRRLTWDASREAFHDPEANSLLEREYGDRFRLPSQV